MDAATTAERLACNEQKDKRRSCGLLELHGTKKTITCHPFTIVFFLFLAQSATSKFIVIPVQRPQGFRQC